MCTHKSVAYFELELKLFRKIIRTNSYNLNAHVFCKGRKKACTSELEASQWG